MSEIKELCQKYGLGQTALSRRLGIPVRTVEDWFAGRRTPPPYLVAMLREMLALGTQPGGNKALGGGLSHVMMIEIEEGFGPVQMPKVVLYNENHLTEEEALGVVRAGEYHPSVLVIPASQWSSLFLNRKEE